MKRLLIVILVAALGWSTYWFIGASGVKSGFVAWFEARQSEGWQAETSDITVAGYPNRFDTTLSDIALADPETGVAWNADFFQVFTLSYKPNHVIAVWPNAQTVAFPDQTVQVSSTDMRASLVLGASTDLPLERTNYVVKDLTLTSTADWTLKAETLQVALHRLEEQDNGYRFALTANGFAPQFAQKAPAGQSLPQAFQVIQADILAGFDAPWDRHALEDARPQPTWIEVRTMQLAWGELELQAAGKVTVDNTGYPTGDLTIRATNWRDIVAVARQSGAIPKGVLDGIERGLEFLAGVSGNAKSLDIPLNFKNGATRLGPIPIGPAPRLVLR
ncbi:DUF2125 domain-containing protein [uncultured Shimia sp.]|uniref:DUF2125 domain-containing protein n=1 Tax=uncultured Shimia sp. TaxID=573152 RepID=UPI00262AF613|nr:DUF2125 domain-containing protein [uncultured Shimia sp.]